VIGADAESRENYQPVRLAPELTAPDGTRYAFLVLPEGISVWGSPATALGIIAVAVVVIASVAWLIARAFSLPIGELQLAVRELASGDTSARVPASIASRNDELGALAADFNTMAARLAALLENRQSVMRDMSHELRSPLARMQAALALVEHRNRQASDEDIATNLARIEHEIGHMNEVIGEMLRYSSVDTTISPQRRLVRIDRLLNELIEIEEIEAIDKGCRLTLDTESNLTVVGDPELLRSGLENIIRNAIRFAPPDTAVEVAARRSAHKANDLIAISVEDRGPGVAAEHLENIFEPYFRIAEEQDNQLGTGLGLAIVKRVFSSHGGAITARQRAGGGLVLEGWLPAANLD
jgi:signal transduction histidine kinase